MQHQSNIAITIIAVLDASFRTLQPMSETFLTLKNDRKLGTKHHQHW